MPFEKVGPGIRRAIGAWLNPLFLEDVADRLATDLLNPQFSQFPDDTGVSEARGPGDGQDEFPNVPGLPLPAFRILGLGARSVAQPAVEGGRCHDRRQFFDRAANHLAELHQPFPFGRAGVNLSWDTRPQDLVLILQILDILGQLVVRGGWKILIIVLLSQTV